MGKKRKHYRSRGTPIGVVLQPEKRLMREEQLAQAQSEQRVQVLGETTSNALQNYESLLHQLCRRLFPAAQYKDCLAEGLEWLIDHQDLWHTLSPRDPLLPTQPERWWRAAVLVWLEIHANLGNRIVLRRKSGATTLISLQLVDPSAESAPWNT